ncbi:hypothetical protein [Streptomyces sp. NPDC001315]|uniref:hypothetical protein n=1 Tax=Streptomyces sp. NPDC001315 TaxID=3364562 RepID=UPI00367BE97F
MIPEITIGAASVMGALVLAVATIRWAITPPAAAGRHRARRCTVLEDASLDELLGSWPQPAHGAAVVQAWRDCPTCEHATPGVVTETGVWWCGECLTAHDHTPVHTTTTGEVLA